MSPKLRFAIFLAVVIGIVIGLHVYLWQRLVRDTALPQPWRRVCMIVLIGLMAGTLGLFFLRRTLPQDLGRVALFPLYLWMGMAFFLFLLLLSGDLFRLGVKGAQALTQSADAIDSGRRAFFARLFGGASVIGTSAVAALGSRAAMALSSVKTQRIEVPLQRLPSALDGLRIVQISDLHIGPTLGREWLAGIVARVNALKPDLIAITGDFVDGAVDDLSRDIAPLADLRAKHGVFGCTGNHEYYSGAVAWCDKLRSLGVRMLRNERVAVEHAGAALDIAGVDDFNAKGMAPGHGADLGRALNGRDPAREVVLLAHQPRAVIEAAELDVGLQLSGHTHGGQIWPWNYLVRLQQPYIDGLVDHRGTKLYINQGTGFWGPPIRLGTYAEITELTLRRARS